MSLRLGVQCLDGSQVPIAEPDNQDQINDDDEQSNGIQIGNRNTELQQDGDAEEGNNRSNIHPQVHAADDTLGLAKVEHPGKGSPKNKRGDKGERQYKGESEIVKIVDV